MILRLRERIARGDIRAAADEAGSLLAQLVARTG
jgi:hypothetical protein